MTTITKTIEPQVVPALENALQVSDREHLYLRPVGTLGRVTHPDYQRGFELFPMDRERLLTTYGEQPGLRETLETLDAYAVEFTSFIVVKELERPKPTIEVPDINFPWKSLGIAIGAVCVGLATLGMAAVSMLALAVDPVVCGILPGPEGTVVEIFKWHDSH